MPIFPLNGVSSLAAVRVTKHFAIFQSKSKISKQQI